jgi:hypothetical protein
MSLYICMWGAHLKYMPFYCSIAHQLKGTGMRRKLMFVDSSDNILQMFNGGTEWPNRCHICINFSPHVVKQVGVTTVSLILLAHSSKVVANDGMDVASLMYPQKKNQGK